MTETRTPVEFTRIGLTTPCPVPVEAGTGRCFDDEGEPLPMEQRTELCAVDAGWMIGNQRLCDYHLRELFERGFFNGDFAELCHEAYEEYGTAAAEQAVERAKVPWSERKRYSQDEARHWHESAQEHGLA